MVGNGVESRPRNRTINLQIFTDVPAQLPIIGARQSEREISPARQANRGISGQNAAVSCAKNLAFEVEKEVENPYNAKL